jgi:type II secretory pathway pseudopilin PulG
MKTPPQTGLAGIRAFSLVELLAVTALVALLSGATAMMFTNGRSAGLQTSAAEISGALTMARDLAVTSNRRTRFIIVSGADDNPGTMRLKSYCILQYDPAQAAFATVFPLKHLPAGVYFDEDQENEAAGRGVFDFRDRINLRGTGVDYAYVEFLPAGGTTAASGANIFSLVAGSAAGEPLPGAKDYVRLGVAQHTGRVKVERR